MSAPKGNQFWKLRSKHGRDKLFETPELMWQAACEYFSYIEQTPYLETKPMVVSNGKSRSIIEMVKIPVKKPFTLQGLCLYMGCNTAFFRNFKSQKRAQKEDFSTIITQIEEVIYNQKLSGAISGFFNSNIIARDLGLKDSTVVDDQITINVVRK